jgi:catechol-2,3-dioxygenase
MNFQGVVLNVADLNRSIDFYCEVLGFTVRTQEDQLAALSASESDPGQVMVLRAIGTGPLEGARHIGLRSFVLEAESIDQLERIASDLESRKLLITRRAHSDWTAVVGRDLDGVSFVVNYQTDEGRSSGDGWKVLDDFLYGVGE